MHTLSKELLCTNHMPRIILAIRASAMNKAPAFSDLVLKCWRQQWTNKCRMKYHVVKSAMKKMKQERGQRVTGSAILRKVIRTSLSEEWYLMRSLNEVRE